ncbi:MAG TPA: cupin domain-containing protein [Bacteroidales bacterium]|nr:cupin domain-containing protein [Bacteroidales bacterium]
MGIIKYKQAKPQHPGENIERHIIHLDNLMTAIIDFSNGPMREPDPPHHHPHEQITYVAKGELYFFIDKERYHLEEGDAISIPSDIPHTIQTISKEVRLIDSFSPVREDFITS